MGTGDAQVRALVLALLATGAVSALLPARAAADLPAAMVVCMEVASEEAGDASGGKLKRCKKAIKKAWRACRPNPLSTKCAKATAKAVAICGSFVKGPWNFIVCLVDASSVWDYFKCLTGLDWFDDDDDEGGEEDPVDDRHPTGPPITVQQLR